MPHATQVVLDGFQYAVVDVELPAADPTGVPTGEMVAVRQLVIKDGDLDVTIQLPLATMKELGQALSGSKIIQATKMPGQNGGSPILPG